VLLPAEVLLPLEVLLPAEVPLRVEVLLPAEVPLRVDVLLRVEVLQRGPRREPLTRWHGPMTQRSRLRRRWLPS